MGASPSSFGARIWWAILAHKASRISRAGLRICLRGASIPYKPWFYMATWARTRRGTTLIAGVLETGQRNSAMAIGLSPFRVLNAAQCPKILCPTTKAYSSTRIRKAQTAVANTHGRRSDSVFP